MTDYIPREAAIKRFTFATLDCLGMEPTIRASDVVLVLQSIPAADVRPVVRGAWRGIGKTGIIFVCSACDKTFPYKTRCCPNCGAEMRGESDE